MGSRSIRELGKLDIGGDPLPGMTVVVSVIALLIGSACSRNQPDIETRTLSVQNPTSWDFRLPVPDLRSRFLSSLELKAQFDAPMFPRPSGDSSMDPTLVAETKPAALFGRSVLELPGNEEDLYLHNFHFPLWRSPIYRRRDTGEGLPFLAEFHVHFAAIEKNLTRVSITALKTEVQNGETWGIGHGGPGWFWKFVPVKPTSVEEYVVLEYLGRSADPKMAAVRLPDRQ